MGYTQLGEDAVGIRLGWRQAGDAEYDLDGAGPGALVVALAPEPKDLSQVGVLGEATPTAILIGQGRVLKARNPRTLLSHRHHPILDRRPDNRRHHLGLLQPIDVRG